MDKLRTDSSFKAVYGVSMGTALFNRGNVTVGPTYNICKDVIYSIFFVIYSKKDFYLMDAINEKIELLQAAGLIEFWDKQNINTNSPNEQSNYPKVLTITHFIGSFQILLIGFLISLVAFVMELMIVRLG